MATCRTIETTFLAQVEHGIYTFSTRKWKTNKGRQLKVGQLVLLKQQDLAPLNWRIGRVEQVHADSEGNARSAAIKTATGSLIRPLSKIAILPIES